MTQRLESFGFFWWLIDDSSHFQKTLVKRLMSIFIISRNLSKIHATYLKITQPLMSLLPEIYYWMTRESWIWVFFPQIRQMTLNDSSHLSMTRVMTRVPKKRLWLNTSFWPKNYLNFVCNHNIFGKIVSIAQPFIWHLLKTFYWFRFYSSM